MLAIANEVQAECPELREIIRFAEWDAFLASGDPFDGELPDVDPTDPVMIQYTSGTTGFPKGALLHHRGLVNNGAHTSCDRMGVGEGGVYVTMMPLFHTGGSVMAVLGCGGAPRARRCWSRRSSPGSRSTSPSSTGPPRCSACRRC